MLNEKPNLDSGVLHPIRKDIWPVCRLLNYVQNTGGGRSGKDMKDKDTPESIFFLSFLCMLSFHGMLTLLLWNPEGLAGAQRRLVALKEGARCKIAKNGGKRPNAILSTFRGQLQLRVAKLEGRVIAAEGIVKYTLRGKSGTFSENAFSLRKAFRCSQEVLS